ncbi:MAG: Phosphate propanoyltransferase [candidate division WS2 bacterium]|nr:Phosphate propanoyltransferase [Candidatus Lithacetigena glycinireducens]
MSEELRQIVEQIVVDYFGTFPVEVSNRHIHLSPEHLETLFGKGYQLNAVRQLSQPGEFAAQETLTLLTPHGVIPNLRVLGPIRSKTQLEMAASDARKLKINPPLGTSRSEENLKVILVGPLGVVELSEGVIISQRHLHATPEEASRLGVKDGQLVEVEIGGERPGILGKVPVRVSPDYKLALHIDIDEGNALGVKEGFRAKIYKRS